MNTYIFILYGFCFAVGEDALATYTDTQTHTLDVINLHAGQNIDEEGADAADAQSKLASAQSAHRTPLQIARHDPTRRTSRRDLPFRRDRVNNTRSHLLIAFTRALARRLPVGGGAAFLCVVFWILFCFRCILRNDVFVCCLCAVNKWVRAVSVLMRVDVLFSAFWLLAGLCVWCVHCRVSNTPVNAKSNSLLPRTQQPNNGRSRYTMTTTTTTNKTPDMTTTRNCEGTTCEDV